MYYMFFIHLFLSPGCEQRRHDISAQAFRWCRLRIIQVYTQRWSYGYSIFISSLLYLCVCSSVLMHGYLWTCYYTCGGQRRWVSPSTNCVLETEHRVSALPAGAFTWSSILVSGSVFSFLRKIHSDWAGWLCKFTFLSAIGGALYFWSPCQHLLFVSSMLSFWVWWERMLQL